MATPHVRGPNWSNDEDVALCLAWVSISEDGAVGTNQKKMVLWGKILDKFHSNSNANRREANGIYERWKMINKACTLWKGSLDRAVVGMASGRSMEEVGDKAMAIYKTRTTPKNQTFKLHHAWEILKDSPKWRSDADQQWAKTFTHEASSVNLGDDLDNSVTPSSSPSISRPPGRDKQKQAKRKGKTPTNSVGEVLCSGVEKLVEGRGETTEEMVRMRKLFERQVEKEDARDRLAQQRFDFDVMREDPNKYTPIRKKFFRDAQAEIVRRHTARNIFEDDDPSNVYIPSPPSQGPSQANDDEFY